MYGIEDYHSIQNRLRELMNERRLDPRFGVERQDSPRARGQKESDQQSAISDKPPDEQPILVRLDPNDFGIIDNGDGHIVIPRAAQGRERSYTKSELG